MSRTDASESPIRNVVVLMMENHSFDHVLGYLPGVGTLAADPQSLPDPSNPGQEITTYQWTQYSISPCPVHDHSSVMGQLYGLADLGQQPTNGVWPTPPMNGFLDDYLVNGKGDPQQLMGNFTPSQLPALSMLASTYTVCTNWFCSVPGPTGPNRLFVNCASSGGYAGPAYQSTTMPSQLSTLPSLFGLLDDAGLTWGIYHEDPTFFPEGVLEIIRNNQTAMTADPFFSRFQSDVGNGTLSSYSFLTPSLPNSQHDSWDARVGDDIIALIYNTLYDSSTGSRRS
jgi:phospholipase C